MTTTTQVDGGQGEQPLMPGCPIPLNVPVVTIGRYPDNTVILKHPLVSGHHARIEQTGRGGHRIVDLGSTNRVYVNGQRVANQVLKPGDEIRIAPYKFTYRGAWSE